MAAVELRTLDDAEVRAALAEHGTHKATADAFGVAKSTLQRDLLRRGLSVPRSNGQPRGPQPTLTRESLHKALLPPNNCKVKPFLESLDGASLEVVEEALGYSPKDFPSNTLRNWLIGAGFREQDLPGADAFNDHRAGRRPCRCKG